MEDQTIMEVKPSNKNRNLIIAVVAAVVVLCCCCLIIIVAGTYSMFAIRSEETSFPATGIEATPQFDYAPEYVSDDPPVGGLGNDILKNDTWQTLIPVAMGYGCTAVGEDSSIEVLQEPDGGVWLEKWTVACASGDSLDFEVEFILDDSGATFNITPLQ